MDRPDGLGEGESWEGAGVKGCPAGHEWAGHYCRDLAREMIIICVESLTRKCFRRRDVSNREVNIATKLCSLNPLRPLLELGDNCDWEDELIF